MNVTRDVMNDLLPVYFSGEASADTQRLVEEYFRENPDFERAARDSAKPLESLRAAVAVAPEAEREKRDLECVRGELRRRKVMFGVALLFTLTPLAFLYSNGHFIWLLREDPLEAVVFWSMAAILWLVYLARLGRRTASLLLALIFILAPILLDLHFGSAGLQLNIKGDFSQLWDAALFWSVAALLLLQYFARLRRRIALLLFAIFMTLFPIPAVWYLVSAGGPHIAKKVAGPAVLWVFAAWIWARYFRHRRKPDSESECQD